MINITRSGNNVIVTSDNPRAFNIANGELSVPLNSIYYVLDDESDFIQFNSLDEKGEILFNGLIGDIQVNGTLVTRDDIQIKLDSVFNASSGGTASAGVNSINGEQGDINIKTINGESLIGDGDIIIEGGSSVEETDPVFTEWKNGTSIAIGKNNTASYNGVNIGTYNGEANTSILIGQYLSGNSGSIIIGADTKSNNDGEILLGNAAKSNTGETTSDKTHVAFAKYGSSYGNESNCFEIRQDNGIYIWDADNTEMIKLQDHLGGGITEESDPIFTEWKSNPKVSIGGGGVNPTIGNGIAIGSGTSVATNNGIAIGYNVDVINCIGIGKNINMLSASPEAVYIGNSVTYDYNFYTNINNVIKGDTNGFAFIKAADGSFVQLNTEWTGTQAEYDALTTKYDTITYNIIEE